LPAALRVRLGQQYGLSAYDAGVLTSQGRALAAYFEEVVQGCGDAKAASNWITNQVLATLKERKQEIADFPLPAARLAELIAEQKKGLTRQAAISVYAHLLERGGSVQEALDHLDIRVQSDGEELRAIVGAAIADNARAVADFKKGKTAAANAIKGAVMKKTKGAANPEAVQKLLMEELQKM
jgi:aspartyl-tRNA(Asn)/glutamyl-tRNA(Gln) amidotransferase subunit B